MKNVEFMLAFKNVFRNKRRTLITVATVAIAVGVSALMRSLAIGFENMIASTAIEQGVGALQIHKKGYDNRGGKSPLDFRFKLNPSLIAKIRSHSEVAELSFRIIFEAQVSNGTNQTVVSTLAFHPDHEKKVCPSSLVAAVFLQKNINTNNSIFLGDALAQAMLPNSENKQTKPTLTLLATNSQGRQNALDAEFAGPFSSSNPFQNKRVAIVSLDFAQRLLGMPEEVTEIAVSVHTKNQIDNTVLSLQQILGDDFEVRSWIDIMPTIKATVQQQQNVMSIVVGILSILVAFGLANTMMLGVSERTREIGTMASFGTSSATMTRVFIFEGSIIGLLGGLIGTPLFGAVILILGHFGFAMPIKNGNIPLMLYPELDFYFLFIAILFGVIIAALASLVPARKAAKLNPIEALASL